MRPVDVNDYPMFFLNRHRRRLFGVYHEPVTRASTDLGVVFCHPLGEEKQYSDRAYVKWARHFAAAGYPTLRFDGYGFGDSEGDLVEATVHSLCADTMDAMTKLCELASVSRFALIGARFGATIAALVAATDQRVAGLVLCSPIVSGGSYRETILRSLQVSELAGGKKAKKREELLAEIKRSGRFALDAQLASGALMEQLAAVNLLDETKGFLGPRIVTALTAESADRVEVMRLEDAYRAESRGLINWDEDRDFWSHKSLYDGYLPTTLYDRTASWLGELQA